MLSFPRFCVSAYRFERTPNNTQLLDSKNREYLINEKMMCIERMTNNRAFRIFGEQKNSGATYLLYLELDDPYLPQDTTVEWTMYDKLYTGKVKTTFPLSLTIMNRKAEVYIQSDNE